MLNRVYDKYLAAYTCVAGRIHDFKRNEKGVTAVEYAIVIGGVAAVVAIIFGEEGVVHDLLKSIFSNVDTAVKGSMGIGGGGGTPAP